MFLVEGGPKTPEVSMAIGSNLKRLAISGYFALLAVSAIAAACPTSIAVSLIELLLKVFKNVAS